MLVVSSLQINSLYLWWLETCIGNLKFKDSAYCTEKTCLLQIVLMVCLVSHGEWLFLWAASAENQDICLSLLYYLSLLDHPWMFSIVSALVEFHFCWFTSLVWWILLAVAGIHLVVLLAVYLVLTCFHGCLLLCVSHPCLSSCQFNSTKVLHTKVPGVLHYYDWGDSVTPVWAIMTVPKWPHSHMAGNWVGYCIVIIIGNLKWW